MLRWRHSPVLADFFGIHNENSLAFRVKSEDLQKSAKKVEWFLNPHRYAVIVFHFSNHNTISKGFEITENSLVLLETVERFGISSFVGNTLSPNLLWR